jgi:hypothetical protein
MTEKFIAQPELEKKCIPEELLGMPDADFMRLSMSGFSNPAEIQEQVLKQILKTSQETEIGKKYKFAEINSVEDFQTQIPIKEWSDVEPYSERMADGESDLLFPGMAKQFVLTSGTTGNSSKMVPESERGSLAKQVVSRFRRMQLIRNLPQFDKTGYVLPLSNVLMQPPTKAGIPVGFASGIALKNSMGEKQMLRMAFPMDVLLNKNTDTRDYLLLRFALQKQNVVMVVGNNAGRFSQLSSIASLRATDIINDIENGTVRGVSEIDPMVLEIINPQLAPDPERAAELRQILEKTGDLQPKEYWPNMQLMAFWLSASVGHYIKDVKPLVSEKAAFFDAGYGSSEVRINIPTQPNNAAGTLSVYTAFYEFIPESGGNPLLAHQLEDGKLYELVVTTWSGLYRYNMKDKVKVEGFTGNTPNIVFAYKSGEILNIAEEKVPASLVANSIRQVSGPMGVDVVQIQVYPNQEDRTYYCYLEASSDFDSGNLSELAHLHLSKNSFAYDMMCNHQKMIHPLQIVPMKTGWQQWLYADRIQKVGSATQVKLPVMVKEEANKDWIKENDNP